MGKRRFPYPVEATAGPFFGAKDTDAATNADPSYAYVLQNVYPEVTEQGAGLRTRPPFRLVTPTAPLGTVSSRTFQGFGTFRPADGTAPANFAVCGGKLYRITYGSTLATVDVTPSGGVTIDASARHVYLVQFGTSLIVSDGVNRPWKTTNAHTSVGACTGSYLTDVAQAWYGAPVVYYAKLFGIQATARTTLEWSEEVDPDTGYSNATYDNTWILAQTSSAPLEALCATNDAVVYFRRDSIGLIQGAVTKDFRTSGTHDLVSAKVGTRAAAAVQLIDGDVWFTATDGRPYRYRIGGGLDDLWREAEVTSRPLSSVTDLATGALVVDNAATDCVLFTDPSGTSVTQCLVFTRDGRFVGTWTHFAGSTIQFRALGTWLVDTERTELLVQGDDDGHVYVQLDPFSNPSTATDATVFTSGSHVAQAIPVVVQAPALGRDLTVQALWDRVTWLVQATATNSLTVRLDYQTNLSTFDTSQDITATVGDGAGDLAMTAGLNAHGRWIRPRLRAPGVAADCDVIRVLDVRVEGTALTDAPGLG